MGKKKKLSMSVMIFIAMILGIVCGMLFGKNLSFLKVIGDIFIRLIQMSIVLLIMGQILEAVGGLNITKSGKIIAQTVTVFLISSFLAALVGVYMGWVFKPGRGANLSSISNGVKIENSKIPSLGKMILDFFPSNVFTAMSKGNIVQTIVFSIVFGIALSIYINKSKNDSILRGIKQINGVVITMISLIMKLAPIGVFALIASTIGSLGLTVIRPMFRYLLVFGFGTVMYLLLWLVVVSISTRISPIALVKNMSRMSMMALATTSSAVTFPIELRDAKEKIGIKDGIAQIVLSLGMSLNSNGSAMHMAITLITISQIYNIHYSYGTLVYIALLSTLASLANAVVPGAALVSLTIVVPQMGLPIESIAIFAGVDWFVGMFRTILNVDSDVFSAIMVARFNGAIKNEIPSLN